MSNIDYARVPLPSRGLLYEGKIPDGVVDVRKLKVGEEIVIQSTASGIDMVSKLVTACCRLPNSFAHDQLLSSDRMAILIALRVYTFGPAYSFSYTCRECGAKNKADCNLASDLKPREAADRLVEPVEVDLKDAKVRVGLRFLRGIDEANIARTAKRMAMQSNDQGDPSLIPRMVAQLVTVDGEPLKNDYEKEQFVRNLTMPDGQDWRDALDEAEPGIDLRVYPECKACGAANELALPFGAEFFRPTRTRG